MELSIRKKQLLKQLKSKEIAVAFIKKLKLDRLTQGAVHQGVAAELAKRPPVKLLDQLTLLTQQSHTLILALDRVYDPQNLGACFRSAYAAGFHAILSTVSHCSGITSTTRKAACGATEKLPFIQVKELEKTLIFLQKEWGFNCVALDAEARHTIYALSKLTFSFNTKGTVLVLGSEGQGLRPLVKASCPYLVKIPMIKEAESLNLSCAASVACFELQKQYSSALGLKEH